MASSSGYTVESLNENGDVVDVALDVGTRNGEDAEDSLPNDCEGKDSLYLNTERNYNH